MTFDLERVRAEAPSVLPHAYLNAGTFGPLPSVARDAMHAHLARSFEHGRIGHAGIMGWLGQLDEARRAFAATLACSPDEVALNHATTDGCNTIVWGLGLAEGDEVVLTREEHPGLTAPLEELARVRGVILRTVPADEAALVAAVGPRTRLVAVSHVLWTSGHVLDVATVASEVRARVGDQAFLLVDGAQSVGALDVAPATLGVDAYTVSGQKWLCGPSGTGALWVRPDALERLGTPWPWYLSRDRSPHGVRDWPTARRLDATTLGMTSLAGAIAALAWQREAYTTGGREHARSLADEVRRHLAASPRVSLVPAPRPSQLVSFRVADEPASAVARRLESHGVLVRSIPGVDCVRAAVGFWNDAGDLDALVRALDVHHRT
ncbi:MAG: aminotransferase class V-fold PLP-dependent enzyme [Deltaproteobacteria bacterium]|nr:aminotransferase class V-fold PLP-dependent enzyme [Deltaproteobacteria bacterium]